MFTDVKIERQRTFVNRSTITVLSRFSGTINPNLPAEVTELPMFPGIDVELIKGQAFDTMAMDIQVIGGDSLIHRTWHMEDRSTAQAQLLGKAPIVEFGFDPAYLDFE